MTPWMWFFLVAAIGNAVLIYVFRRHPNFWIRLAFALAMIIAFFALIKAAADRDDRAETVWHPDAIHWTKVPLGVHWNEVAFAVYREPLEEAMKTWNNRVGCAVFEKAISEASSTVKVRAHDGTACGKEVAEGKDTPVRAHYCGTYFDIQVKRLDHMGLSYRIFLHEFGHALGLDHDDVGAMSEHVRQPRDGDYPENLLPSNKDVAALKERYCR